MQTMTRFLATAHIAGVQLREGYQARLERLQTEREAGMTTLEYAIITAAVIGIALAFAALAKTLYDKYAGQLG